MTFWGVNPGVANFGVQQCSNANMYTIEFMLLLKSLIKGIILEQLVEWVGGGGGGGGG